MLGVASSRTLRYPNWQRNHVESVVVVGSNPTRSTNCLPSPTAEATASKAAKVGVRISGKTPARMPKNPSASTGEHALVEEQADSPGSEPGGRKALRVQFPPGAPIVFLARPVKAPTENVVGQRLNRWKDTIKIKTCRFGRMASGVWLPTRSRGFDSCNLHQRSRGFVSSLTACNAKWSERAVFQTVE